MSGALVASGYSNDQAAKHKDRLRYLVRKLRNASVVPLGRGPANTAAS